MKRVCQLGAGRNAIGQFSHGDGVCQWILTGLLMLLLFSPTHAAENCFPRGKSVTFVIPYGIGTAENFYARMLKTVAEEAIGSQFNPNNVPARGGIEGMTELFGARPSGGTLGMLNAADAIVAGLAGAVPFELNQFTIFGRIVDNPQAVYVGQSAFAKGIKNLKSLTGAQRTLVWGITSPASFFAAVVIDDLFEIDGKFKRVGGSAAAAFEAATGGEVDLVVLNTRVSNDTGNHELIPILALGPAAPTQPSFEKHQVPLLRKVVKSGDREKALSLADISASGLIIAGPPFIPSLRVKCIQAAFQKALQGPNLRALARAANRRVEPLAPDVTEKLVQKAEKAAVPFKSIWVDALKELKNSQ